MMMLFGITKLLDAILFVLHCNHVTIVVDEFYNGGVANVNAHILTIVKEFVRFKIGSLVPIDHGL